MAPTGMVENDCQLAQASPEETVPSPGISAFNVFVLRIVGDFQFVIRIANCFATF
jgi:hypothetical protein